MKYLMPFLRLFQSYRSSHCLFILFWNSFHWVLCTVFFSNHWLLYHITIIKIVYSSARGLSPVTMTIINPLTKYWLSRGSNRQPPVLKSCTFSPIPTMFSTYPKKNICFSLVFILSAANALSLDQSKYLSFGKELCQFLTEGTCPILPPDPVYKGSHSPLSTTWSSMPFLQASFIISHSFW